MSEKFFKISQKPSFKIMMALFMVIAISSISYASTQGNADELDDVWTHLKDGVSGTYGKLASIGIIGAAIWHREKIGMLVMGISIIIGALIPSIPGIIDGWSYTI